MFILELQVESYIFCTAEITYPILLLQWYSLPLLLHIFWLQHQVPSVIGSQEPGLSIADLL